MIDKNDERTIRDLFVKSTPRPLLFFDVSITEHCNLNCAHCGSFAPLADEEYLDIEQFEKDMKRLSDLSGGGMHYIQILGGEPLLNPNINEYLKIARHNFPSGIIRVVTNGLLIKSMKDDFWEICRDNRINISATEYPINLDYEELRRYVEGKQVKWEPYGKAEPWLKLGLAEMGHRNPNHSFFKCPNSNNCCAVRNGKIYACSRIDKMRHLNKFFGKKFEVNKGDWLDIYQIESIDEIMAFLSKPSPFCRYCNPFNTKVVEWEQSEKNINEWL